MAVIVVMVLCLVFVNVHRSVSGQSSCKCSSEVLDCRGQNLTSLHETLPSHLNCEGASRIIVVSQNKLKKLNFSKEFMQRNRNASIHAENNNLTSLNGLEDWTGNTLSIKGNNFSSVNVSPWKNHLKVLDISFNHLTILDLSSMKNLVEVYADNNSLTRLILPSERCLLQILQLGSNKLSLLPTEIHKCVDLTKLSVDHNNLSLLDLSSMENLVLVVASTNSLSHLILPSERCSLQILHLDSNKLSLLPTEIHKCKNLTYLSVHYNNLTLLDLSSMKNLSEVYAYNNSLSHLILPSERCSLQILDLDSNKLSLLPTETPKCINLISLSVLHNNLSLLDLSSMEILIDVDASNNSLSNLILPSARCSLEILYLEYNKLSMLPIELHKCENLSELSITNNNLVELDLSEMFRLVYVAASRNAMKTLILPQESCSILRITLTFNKLTSIPQELSLCSHLQHIELDDNALKVFPDCLLNLMKHRSDASRRTIFVNVRRNPLTLLEIFSTFRDFVQQQGLFMHLFDEDFFTIKERDCECSEMKLEHFAPVVYCATIMCDKGENLWQHL